MKIILSLLVLVTATFASAATVRVDLLENSSPTGEYAAFALTPGTGKFGSDREYVDSTTSVNGVLLSSTKQITQISGFQWTVDQNPTTLDFRVTIRRVRHLGDSKIAGDMFPVTSVEVQSFAVSPSLKTDLLESKTFRTSIQK